MSSISIIVCAWKIPSENMLRFISWNREVFSGLVDEVVFVCDRPEEIPGATTLVYPGEQPIFSIPRTINYGIRRAKSDIIIKTDMDIIFSRAVLEQVISTVDDDTGLICICANIKNHLQAKQHHMWSKVTKRRKGRGACFAMARSAWFSLNGYNEKIEGWGGDDEEMWRRACRSLKIEESWANPLYHVNHPLRKEKNTNFPILSSKNIRIGKTGWSSESWGDPAGEFRSGS